ncbi:MAG: tetratricopeptide repeat protein [Prevotellaceae bacterium]|nr:tetratricopeptide repeat protein [Prevotellaceae bacterium]
MKKTILLLLVAFVSTATLQAQKKTFTRDYTYQASEADSKLTARAIATTQMRNILLREIGEFLKTERTLKTDNTSQEYAEKIEAITAGIIEMKTLDEKWDGAVYYIQAEMTVDPAEVNRRIAEVLNDKQKTKELEESRKRTLAAEAEVERLKKEMAESKNQEQSLTLQKNYQQNADALSAEEYFTKGYNAVEKRFYQLAIEYYQKAVDINPNYEAVYFSLGGTYMLLKNYHEAILCFQKALEFDPNNFVAYSNLGLSYNELNHHHEAIQCYQKAIDIDPNYAIAYINMGTAYAELGKKKEKIKYYQKAAQLGDEGAQNWLRHNGKKW